MEPSSPTEVVRSSTAGAALVGDAPTIHHARWPIAITLCLCSIAIIAASIQSPSRGPFVQPLADEVSGLSPEAAAVPSVASLIDINTAPAEALQLLPRIGPVLAARIIEDRQAAGPYASLEELDRVRGIGPRTIEGLRDMATVSLPQAASQASD